MKMPDCPTPLINGRIIGAEPVKASAIAVSDVANGGAT